MEMSTRRKICNFFPIKTLGFYFVNCNKIALVRSIIFSPKSTNCRLPAGSAGGP